MQRRHWVTGLLFVACFISGVFAHSLVSSSRRKAEKWDEHCNVVRASFSAAEFGLKQPQDLKYRAFMMDRFLDPDHPLPHQSSADALECGVSSDLLSDQLRLECRGRGDYDCLASMAAKIVEAIPETP